MPAISHVTQALPEDERNRRIYAGEIIVFQGFSAVAGLVELLREHCRAHLGPEPERNHEQMAEAEMSSAATALHDAVRRDDAVRARLNDVLQSVGMDLDANYGDGLKQRVQSARAPSGAHMLGPLAAHRDTWGSNLWAQTNWWAPVFPTTPERTIALFPTCFARPVSNDSADWDFAELVRRSKSQGAESDYPLLPLISEELAPCEALPLSLTPGELLCFSGAHLHASVPNTTDRSRLSFETRTVNGADVAADRGASNVDGRAPRVAYQLFKGLADGRRLGVMERYRSS